MLEEPAQVAAATSSIDQFQRELDQSRLIPLCVDDAELRCSERHTRIAKPDPVEHIEELGPKLEIHFAFFVKPVIIGDAEVQIIGAMVADIGERSRGISEREGRWLAEYAGVEESREPGARIALQP